MTDEQKFNLITRNLDEVLTEEELKALIASGTPLKHYIGFEISGKVHLGTGLATLQKVKELYQAGAETIIWLADWHGWINNKLDGTLETSQKMARLYFEEAMKAAYLCLGGDPSTLIFRQGSEIYKENPEFWATTIKVAKATTISRMLRSTTIMGRQAGESSDTASLFYPAMQAADIFTLSVNITHAGTDQRNVHVVARDVSRDLNRQKPVAIHHHLLQGLLKPAVWPIPEESREDMITALKMSKSKPDSAVFIHDSPEEIRRKVNNAFAPEEEVKFNPILDWCKHLIFYNPNTTLVVKRDEKWGGDLHYTSYQDLEADYGAKKLHPQDLKQAVAEWLIAKLEPARKYFEDPQRKTALEEIEKFTKK
ncbi:MAG: Tyrosine-tRNA ligase [Candidatus Daviesbacteria bacterium GW2011_GWA1_41_61]|uniref:tyrosine--tRNA ligase n=1 Tax=Candidatus Daviesbacteria bacterium GW2011_GWA2_40_9 TaxID=1618424 RepID=A0A0G0WHL4_9BACT|nr:MAG: tyrosyl-tRNA synthetase, tyrosyl-tRNA synthetase [Candidatus Daviesbacteria bacterium GW2011_GWC1_40_9]KKR83830.1 MAG: Tyrosine-tRNA ligase [Candidatus Daviesbacteria bacterium GW2011_GWA2_40_9]KKR93439.1 MAG: Tyrosine-tRNA ligase [Candidatus Daviesbacteria bacterium GW2011_GWB1_41_15]KKS15012.1 MAG: Tyrosine-tRNA ligase [Candidatus Daviesbacteria bacterium GW2011_GWA1_41_61]